MDGEYAACSWDSRHPASSGLKKFSRKQLLAYTANVETALVGIEACSGAHFIGAAHRDQGHDVRLIPAQFVKPFVGGWSFTLL